MIAGQRDMQSTGDTSGASDKIIPLNGADTHPLHPNSQTSAPASPTASRRRAVLPSERFKYRGRTWRIFKRKLDPDASWQLYFEASGRRHPFSLGTSSKTHAVAEAKLKIDLHFEQRESDLRRSMQRPGDRKYSTIGEILRALPQLPIEAEEKTRNYYATALRDVLRVALDLDKAGAADKLPASVLSKETARAYFDKVTSSAAQLPDQATRNRYLRTACTYYENARALFAPRPLESMRETLGLRLPDMTSWRQGKKLYGPKKLDAASEFHAPADDVIRRTLVEWVKLGNIRDYPEYRIPGCDRAHGDPLSPIDRRNMFIAIGYELSCGFRKGEVIKAQWEWSQAEHGMPVVKNYRVDVKNRSGRIEVTPLDPFWHVLNFWVDRNGWRGSPGDYVLTAREKIPGQHPVHVGLRFSDGGKCDRYYWPFWLVGKWLRWLGWTTQKTNHALRDYSASLITMRYDLGAAKQWCRHSTIVTTEQHYNRFVTLAKRVNAKKLAWIRWARLPSNAPTKAREPFHH